MTLAAQTTRESRRITGESPRSIPRPATDLPIDVIKLRWDYEAKIARLEEKIHELEMSIVNTDSARRATQRQESALTIYGESEEVKAMTTRLNVLLPSASDIGTQGVALVAQIAIAHGLDPLPGSDHIYAWKQGDKLMVTLGYKGLLHLARQQVHFTHQSREMTAVERTARGLKEDQVGYISEVWEIEKAKACKDAGIPYYPIRGEAIWSAQVLHHKRTGGTWTEYGEVPTGRDAHWVARKNSLKDALRQITSTGVRLGQALDMAYAEMGRKAALAGVNVESTVDGWAVALPESTPEDTERELIEAGIIQPDEEDADDQPLIIDAAPRCACGQPVDADGPYPTLCMTCANAKANSQAVQS